MVTLAQRIEALRTGAGYSRAGLCSALGFPKGALDKFETGRATPTKEQQQKLADYFGVSLFYLRGESSDPTRQDDWMSAAAAAEEEPAPASRPPRAAASEPAASGGSLLDALLAGKSAQEALRTAVLEVLRSPEGQALIAKAVRRELNR